MKVAERVIAPLQSPLDLSSTRVRVWKVRFSPSVLTLTGRAFLRCLEQALSDTWITLDPVLCHVIVMVMPKYEINRKRKKKRDLGCYSPYRTYLAKTHSLRS